MAFAHERCLWVIVFLALELGALLTILSNYPGFCSTDSNDIIAQVLGSSYYQNHHRYDGVANHHPVFYTFAVWLVFKLTAFLENLEFSVFCFLALQSLLVSFCVSWSIAWLNRHTKNKAFVVTVILFFAFSPVLLTHTSTMWKDAPFSAVFLVVTLLVFDLSRSPKVSRRRAVSLTLLLILLSLLRNNGIYVSIVLLAYMAIALKESRLTFAKGIAILLAAIMLIQGPIFSLLSIQKGHFSESVGIPLQQIALTLSNEGDVSEYQLEFLEQVLPIEEWVENYNPTSPNPLKFSENFDDNFLENHKGEFVRVWFSLLPNNLNYYLKAWVLETRGYWQPGFQANIGTQTTLYYEEPADLLGFEWNPAQITACLKDEIPLVFDMGSYIWAITLAALICTSRTNGRVALSKRLICFVPAFALFATLLIAAPIVSDYRYVLSLYLILPFLPVLSTEP